MTGRQKELLAYLREYTAEHKYSPSYDEMCAALGLKSKSAGRCR